MSNQEKIEELHRRRARALQLGKPEQAARLRSQGRWDARQWIDNLVDPGSFHELGMMAHSDVPGMEARTVADGVVTGEATIDGRTVLIISWDSTVLAGAGGRISGKKTRHIHEMAVRMGYPTITLSDYGGARIPDIMGSAGLTSMAPMKENFLTARRVPALVALLGNCFGGAAFGAIESDFVIQLKGACMGVSSPRVTEVALSEDISYEELGGWELHSRVTGQVDRVADENSDVVHLIKEFLSYLPSNYRELPPVVPCKDPDVDARQERLLEVLPDRLNRAYDMHDIISILVDDGKYFPIKPEYGQSLITCLARVDGESVGFVASQPLFYGGATDYDGCDKAAAFIALCDSYNIPLVFLHDTPGFLVGGEAERHRVAGKLILFMHAVARTTVPKISVVIRKSYGMAFYNMCGTTHADHLVAWPTAQMSFMSPEAGVNVVHARKLADSPDPEAEKERLIEQWRVDAEPWGAAGLYTMHDIIDPRETRSHIIRKIKFARNGQDRGMSQRLLADWPTSF